MADAKISALPGASTPLAGTEVVPLVQSGATKKVAVSDLTAGRNVSLAQLTATATTQKLADNASADLTVQIGPDTPTAARSSRIGLISSSTQKNWYITNSWNTTGAFCLVQTTSVGGLTMSGTDSHQWLDNGDYKIVNGNLVQGTAAKGVNFTANTPAAGMTSQLLNWYEEGTFTPVAQGSSTAGTATYSTQTGQYTRIGNRVFFNLRIIYTGGTGTGNMRVGGLPFTSNSSMAGAVVSIYADNLAGTASYIFAGLVPPNTTYIGIDQVPVGGGGAIALAYDGAADISISGHYFV